LDHSLTKARIGLFGGSFDPPHVGHAALVEAALEHLRLSAVWIIPAGMPVHRTLSGHATPALRLHWMQRIFAGHQRIAVLDWEVTASEPTPSIVSLRRFAATFPDKRPVLLLGADAFSGMDGWVSFPEHAALCDVAVFGRAACGAASGVAAFRPLPLTDWLMQPAGVGYRVDVDVPLPDVSATGIRQLAAQGKSLAGKVPECVRREIEQAYAGTAV
jgi:nicotinate-nucleotide adenylyltransferase